MGVSLALSYIIVCCQHVEQPLLGPQREPWRTQSWFLKLLWGHTCQSLPSSARLGDTGRSRTLSQRGQRKGNRTIVLFFHFSIELQVMGIVMFLI